MAKRREIPNADHIEVIPCDCGCDTIKIWLYDAADKPFAVASFGRSGILGLANHIVDVVDRVDADTGEEING